MSEIKLPKFTKDQEKTICTVWDDYDANGRPVYDPKGNLLEGVDQ